MKWNKTSSSLVVFTNDKARSMMLSLHLAAPLFILQWQMVEMNPNESTGPGGVTQHFQHDWHKWRETGLLLKGQLRAGCTDHFLNSPSICFIDGLVEHRGPLSKDLLKCSSEIMIMNVYLKLTVHGAFTFKINGSLHVVTDWQLISSPWLFTQCMLGYPPPPTPLWPWTTISNYRKWMDVIDGGGCVAAGTLAFMCQSHWVLLLAL